MDPKVTHREGFFAAKDNLRLYWQSFTPTTPQAIVGVIHGYADHSNRYLPLIDHLTSNGIGVHAFDYRGHGQADGRRGHVDHWSEYLDDFELFLERVSSEARGRKVFLLGHSHGGLILAKAALSRPHGVAGTIYSSPWFQLAIKVPIVKLVVATMVGKVVPWLPVRNEITIDQLSRDADLRRATERDPLYNRNVTPRWFNESRMIQEEVLRRASEIVLPSLVLVPELDTVANPTTQRMFFESITAKDKQLRLYPGAYHELFNEIPETRKKALEDVTTWIRERS